MTDKHDVVIAIERVLDAVLGDDESRQLIDQFQWLLKVWNTDDDRPYEDCDRTKGVGASYDPDKDICERCGQRRQDNCACDDPPMRCQNCLYRAEAVEFYPSDGNPAPVVCPECGSTEVFEMSDEDENSPPEEQ